MSLQSRYRKPKPKPTPASAPATNGTGPLLLTLKQTAVYLGLPLKQIRKLVASHDLKRAPVQTKGFMIARAECDRYAALMFSKSYMSTNPGTNQRRRGGVKKQLRIMTDDQLRKFLE
jgi:hypothetical protein